MLSAGILQDGVKSTGSGMGQNKVHSTVSASSGPAGAGEDEDKISAPRADVRTQRCGTGAPSLSELCVLGATETCLRRSSSFCLAETRVRKRPDEKKSLGGGPCLHRRPPLFPTSVELRL